jgi:hypothetical protein
VYLLVLSVVYHSLVQTATWSLALSLLLSLHPGCSSDPAPAIDLGPPDRPLDGPRAERSSDAASSDRTRTEASVADTRPGDARRDAPAGDAKVVDARQDGLKDDAGCTVVSLGPVVDPWTIRHPSAGFGGILTQQSGGFTDVFLKSPTDLIRVGARLNWGGTIVFFGLSANPGSNVIDANDTGRELQIALYDPSRQMQGCAHNASCPTNACPSAITFLGWNPVQGGDECNHGAPVKSHGKAGDALRLVVQPVQWNPDWAAPDCRKSPCPAQGLPVQVTYNFELRFVREHVVEVMTEVTSQESFSHPATGQEFPTLYVSYGKGGPDLPLLLDGAGNTVTISTPGNDGFFYDNFSSPRPYVSWQNAAKDYGVGLGHDQGLTGFQGWRGDGKTAPYFHNVRAQISFGLPAGGSVRGLSYLALGGFSTVKSELEAVLAKRPPFGVLDTPAGPDVAITVGTPLAVNGWVLDTTAIATVRAEIDGKLAATLQVNGARPDVCAVYPAYAGCPKVGYSGQLPTAGLSKCPHHLRMIAVDPEGNTSVLGERRLVPK